MKNPYLRQGKGENYVLRLQKTRVSDGFLMSVIIMEII